ncbi:MAG: formate dehydrogenase accessory protein FdhE [Actinomycetota bacterium]
MSRQIKRYVEENPRLKGVMGLYREVFSTQRMLSRDIPDQLPHIEGAQVAYRVEEGRLLVEADELAVDLTVLKEMLRELGRVLEKKGGGPVEGMEKFLGEEIEDDTRLRGLVDAFLAREDAEMEVLLGKYSLDGTVLLMLLHISLAPFYWKMAGSLVRKADLGQVPRGRCPVCGDLPIMGLLRPEEGLRVLECSLCGTRWGFPRIMCPFCNTTDQEKLKYIFAGEDNDRRVYLCDACGKYIKVSTPLSEKDEEFVLPLEDLATAHLDIAAEKRGYERGCRTVFS